VSLSREEQLEARIAEAHAAWLSRQNAEAELKRLSQYKRMNKAMRDDQARFARQSLEAAGTLSRVLGPRR
jgi:hypothetical protein